MSRSVDSVTTGTVSLPQLPAHQVAEVVSRDPGRDARLLLEGGLTPGSVVMALRPQGTTRPVALWPCRGRAAAGSSAVCLLAMGRLRALTCPLREGLAADFALGRDFAFGGTGGGWTMRVTRE